MLGIHLTDGFYRYEVVLNAFPCKTESLLLPGIASTELHAYCDVSIKASVLSNVGHCLCLSDDLFGMVISHNYVYCIVLVFMLENVCSLQ